MFKKKFIFSLGLFTIFLSMFTVTTNAAGWGFRKNNHHITPEIGKYQEMIEGTSSYYIGDESKKEVILTFDAGYDNGELDRILNVLKEKEVTASFFITGDFVKRFPDLTIRLANDGHVICNHSYSHHKIQTMTKQELSDDLTKLENAYYDLTNQRMAKYFRPPEGEFDRASLLKVQSLGFKTVFWSIAYRDWEENRQSSKDKAIKSIVDNLHPGAIILLHSVSRTNSESLCDIIDAIKDNGYTFNTVLSLQ